jgi:hypothetical protein
MFGNAVDSEPYPVLHGDHPRRLIADANHSLD